MIFQVSTEESRLDAVISDLARRRSHIGVIASRQDTKIISALTPLQELMGYSTDLRTFTSGTASFAMELSHYEKMTKDETQKVIDRISGFYSPKLY